MLSTSASRYNVFVRRLTKKKHPSDLTEKPPIEKYSKEETNGEFDKNIRI